MQQLGFRSVFAKLFASVMLALTLFAVAMVLLTQLVHDKDAGIRAEVLATQILGQIDPFLQELNVAISKDNRLQARFMLAVVKKSFDIFDESLQAKMGLYDNDGHLLMQTDNSDLPATLPELPSLLSQVFPSFSDTPAIQQAQAYSSTGYTLLYESRLPPKKPALSAALNLFTGTLLLLIIMAGVLWIIARTMTWRINQMSQQMAQLGDGDFSVRVNARGNDEIASLARGFNQAAQKIERLINANNLLLAHASHELRTPITRIRLQIEMMDMLAGTLPTDTKAKFDKRAQAVNRDLSGLNDLVESILLVSRLDAGHVMQQVEHLDLYDLINQERQHYPEATLVGTHITIDGQASMLTHLIRNLLTNATLHGEPPITVLVYGVQTAEEAGEVPDYLLQTVLCSSFMDYNSADFDPYDNSLSSVDDASLGSASQIAPSEDSTPTAAHSTPASSPSVSAPLIYKNGETLNLEQKDGSNTVVKNCAVEDSSALTDSSLSPLTEVVLNMPSVRKTVSKTTLFDKDTVTQIRAATWYPAHASAHLQDKSGKAQDITLIDNRTLAKESEVTASKMQKTVAKSEADSLSDSSNAPRKEGLFKKHIKKSKTEPVCPPPNFAVLAVIDEGTGIPEDKRQEIFSPFVRLQQKKKGSGLGLSLVSQIVAAHQGQILTDTINGHTRFLVVLPVKHDPHYNYAKHS